MALHTCPHDKSAPMIWYASYGSNMDAARFACYVVGGTPSGGAHNQRGCADKRLPVLAATVELPFRLYFAGESKMWTGGSAFIGLTAGMETTRGKAYLITLRQFEDVAAQECSRNSTIPVDMALLRSRGRLTLSNGSGKYDEIVYCGERRGCPVVSLTSPIERRPYTKPSAQYIRTIASGLRSAYHLTPGEICNYFLTKPGVTGNYSRRELLAAIGAGELSTIF